MSRYVLGTISFTQSLVNDLSENAKWKTSSLPNDGTFQVVYGFDHAVGYFCQLFPTDPIAEFQTQKLCGEESCFDFDSLFSELSGVKLGYLLKKYNNENFPMKDGEYLNVGALSIRHQDACFMDLPF